ncbi:GIY-YIG nuclease family protein [Colwellia sp. BRX8-9]|uniref:GIY-YIG nuclease family protein n=1 Tax=Colwellia sp. BRX8-9 TaxID=2759831 RepID=UPI0015F618B0|nr:GIY-YIG nuclease family protein [Colwellia sp. BRX8-9]MBA6348307.1 DUF4041 domain-containing protein [Colwellia sp. BRX8-9]
MSLTDIILIEIVALAMLVYWYYSIRSEKEQVVSDLSILNLKIQQSPPKKTIAKYNEQERDVREKIKKGREVQGNLKALSGKLKKDVAFVDRGINPVVFGMTDTEYLKEQVNLIHEEQKQLVLGDDAIATYTNWSISESQQDGRRMIEAYKVNILNAFNNEFDVIRHAMRHNTLDKAREKLLKLVEQLTLLGETQGVEISSRYIKSKLQEQRIWHKELERKQKEKVAFKMRKELMKKNTSKESSQIDEFDRKLDKNELKLEALKAKIKHAMANDAALINDQINNIENEISLLTTERARKMSQAQLTRVGYIYVISNIGSFGEGIVKIGMTRRLEPMDRVVELGDASVPFKFDVHTLTYVEDAPSVERALHKIFSENRVNKVNKKKEFFKVAPQKVQQAMENMNVESNWYFDCDAREFFESELKRNAQQARKDAQTSQKISLPESI